MKFHGLLALLGLVACVPIAAAGCVNPACACQGRPVTINFAPGIAVDDVLAIDLKGPCGPLPDPICDCNVDTAAHDGWMVEIQPNAPGTCEVKVKMRDGQVVEHAFELTAADDGCCSGIGASPALNVKRP